LILTNDGKFSYNVTNPKKKVNKKYFVTLRDEITKEQIKNLESGIKMSVETNNPVVVIYTANYLQDIGFKKHSAICFETQEVPNLYRDENINIYPTFIDKNTNYERYTKFIFTFK